MILAGLQRFTLIDYPGKMAATLFLSGCSFRCPWCYAPELVLPEEIKRHPKISEKNFFSFLKERRGLLEGLVICGGEPTINKDLPGFIKKIKKIGFLVKLDTNGSNPKMLKNLINDKLIDYVAMDIKAPKEKYSQLTGVRVDIKKIQKSINFLKNSNIDFEFRTTIIPALHKKEDITKIARWIGPAPKYFLQNFKPEKTINPKFKKVKPYSQEYLLEIQKAAAPFFGLCQLR
jgi:pyruvate formate lyase activating enzyme